MTGPDWRGKALKLLGVRVAPASSTVEAASTALTTVPVAASTGADVFYDVAMRRLDEQVSRVDTFASKGATALSVGSTVLPVTFGLLQLQDGTLPWCALLFLKLAGVAFLAVAILCSWALSPVDLSVRPTLADLDSHSWQNADDHTRRWVAQQCAASVAANAPTLGRRAEVVRWAGIALAVEALLLSVAAYLAFTSG